MTSLPRISICTTVNQPDNLRSWLVYHLALGIEHVFLYFDHPDGMDVANEFLPNITVKRSLMPVSALPRDKQQKNLTDAISLARDRFDWILHIDADELFHIYKGDLYDVFGGYDLGTFQLRFHNLEVLRSRSTLEPYDYFKQESLFKPRDGIPFLSYRNGKAAGNLAVDTLRERGVHNFGCDDRRQSVKVPDTRAVILHYPFCNYDKWKTKRNIVDDEARLKGGLYEISNIVIKASGSDEAKLKQFYRQNVIRTDALQLLMDGRATNISRPATIIEYCSPTACVTSEADGPGQKAANKLFDALSYASSPANRSKVKSLLMLSGGGYSTALLVYLLVGTGHRVHVHHIQSRGAEDELLPDTNAVMNIIEFCWQHYREEFSYTTSTEDFQLAGIGNNPKAILFTAARVCAALGGGFDFVFTGNSSQSRTQAIETHQILDAYFIGAGRKPAWLTPLKGLDDIEVYESFPQNALYDLVWSCHQPVRNAQGFTRCRRCAPCRGSDRTSRVLKLRDRLRTARR